jgi:hypothetical protein
MASIIVPGFRNTPIPDLYELDRSHPAFDQAYVWVAANPNRIIGTREIAGADSSLSGSANTALGVGRKWSRISNAGVDFGTAQVITQNTGMTVLVVAAPVASATNMKTAISQRLAGGAFTQSDLIFNANTDALAASSGTVTLVTYHSSSRTVQATSQLDGLPHTWVASNSTTQGYIFRDGVAQALSVNVRSSTLLDASQKLRVGNLANDASTSYAMDDPLMMAVFWNKQLPSGLAQDLSRNPWQLFKKQNAKFYFYPASVIGGGITGPLIGGHLYGQGPLVGGRLAL